MYIYCLFELTAKIREEMEKEIEKEIEREKGKAFMLSDRCFIVAIYNCYMQCNERLTLK